MNFKSKRKSSKYMIECDGIENYVIKSKFSSYEFNNFDTKDVTIVKVKNGFFVKSTSIIIDESNIIDVTIKFKSITFKYNDDTFVWLGKKLLKNNELFIEMEEFSYNKGLSGIVNFNCDETHKDLVLKLIISYLIAFDQIVAVSLLTTLTILMLIIT